MTLNSKLQAFGAAMAKLPGEVYHYRRSKIETPYTVWQEDGCENFAADNRTAEQTATGTLDYFTKREYDPAVDQIQSVLASLPVCWSLNSVQYEEDTGIIHYEWIWAW